MEVKSTDEEDGIRSTIFSFVDRRIEDLKAEEEGEVHVQLLLTRAMGVNADPFGEYLEKENADTSVQCFPLDNYGKGKFQKEIKLHAGNYHFVFKVTIANASEIVLSSEHHKTVLASGREVNYLSCEEPQDKSVVGTKSEKYSDVDQSTPLVKCDDSEDKARSGCCSCCVLT